MSRAGFGPHAPRGGGSRRALVTPEDEERTGDSTAHELVQREDGQKEGPRRAERIRLVLQDLGPSFIKLGQIVSTRPDVLPADVIAELKKLQDAVPPVPFEDIKAEVEGDLAKSIAEAYVGFDPEPLAAASIGQCAGARDARGPAEVVVKVQRPA